MRDKGAGSMMRTLSGSGWRVGLAGLMAVSLLGCGGPGGPPRKETIHVKGKLTVDGAAPGEPLQITCHNKAGLDTKMPTVSQSMSEPDGSFEIATYQKGDGVPPGDYALTIAWLEFNAMSMSFTGKDKLNKRYDDPAKSEITFTVKDKPVDLGEIKLTTK
jgi:hypothetical protein